MKSSFYHIQINVDFQNAAFYRDLMTFLGWKPIFEDHETLGFKSESNGDVWFYGDVKKIQGDYDAIGMNHLAFRVEESADIDSLATYLTKSNVKMLFDTPRHRPEFASSEKETYYQVMFESPDGILFEVVYIGVKEMPVEPNDDQAR